MFFNFHFFNRSAVLLTAIIMMLCSAIPVRAQLKWDRKIAELNASPGDDHVEIRFPFVNAGRYPVTVQKLNSSCGCTTASLARASYAPGERGEVVAIFEIGKRTGLNEKNVKVTTDDASEPETVLTFRVFIWKTVSMSASVLFWNPGDEKIAEKSGQTVRIKVVRDKPLNLVRAECSSPAWQVKLKTVKPGWEYDMDVTLLDSRQDGAGVVTLFADSPGDDPQTFRIRLRVK